MKTWIIALAAGLVLSGCESPKEKPEDVANAFLRLVHRQNCKRAFAFFSAKSQEMILVESAQEVKQSPHYSKQFSPENLYCMSTYANRYLSYVKESARLKSINGTNAVVMAEIREGTNFLIPGFWPTGHTNIPVPMRMVKEKGAWKIDLASARLEREAELNSERQKELAKVEQANQDFLEIIKKRIRQSCPEKMTLFAHWKFAAAESNRLKDELGQFEVEILGAHLIQAPDGPAVQFRNDGEALRFPESLLDDRSCGVVSLRLRLDKPKLPARVFFKGGLYSEGFGIQVLPEGRIVFNVRGRFVTGKQALEPHRFYDLICVWNDEGQKIFVDGQLDGAGTQVALVSSDSTVTEMGRDPNAPAASGSRMTISDLRFWAGKPSVEEIQRLVGAKP